VPSAENAPLAPRGGAQQYRYRELPPPPNATLIFVLGLLSVMGVCFILGPIAWIMGHAERARVRAGRYREDGLLTAGYIMGIISTILMILPLFVALIYILVIAALAAIGAGLSMAAIAAPF
jgi:hypothetical protein